MPSIILDGVMAYGSRIVTIGGNQYKCDEIKIPRSATNADDNDQLGRPQRRRATENRPDFAATLQLATSATVRPKFGDVISGLFDSNYGTEYFTLNPVEYDESAAPGEIRKIQVTGWKLLQGTTPTLVS